MCCVVVDVERVQDRLDHRDLRNAQPPPPPRVAVVGKRWIGACGSAHTFIDVSMSGFVCSFVRGRLLELEHHFLDTFSDLRVRVEDDVLGEDPWQRHLDRELDLLGQVEVELAVPGGCSSTAAQCGRCLTPRCEGPMPLDGSEELDDHAPQVAEVAYFTQRRAHVQQVCE